MKLKNKIALVTGGSSGIGKSISLKFIDEGAKVIVLDIKKPDYEVEYYQLDVSNEDEIKKVVKNVKNVDILVNSAGIYLQSSVEQMKKDDLDKIIDINFKGIFLMCKHVIPLLKKSHGNMINISSGLGIAPEPESPAYCASKAAIIMLTKCMAQKYASQNFRVNAILPGPIDTPMLRNAFPSQKDLDKYARSNPMKRVGKPEEVANVAIFLASDEASYVNGGLYSVDGGESSSSLHSK